MMASWQSQLEPLGAVNRLVTDSRAVAPGDTFVAYPGEKMDGRQFIDQAIKQGANAVIWDALNFKWNAAWSIPNLAVPDLRHQAGAMADVVYGAPSEKLHVIGVTGTNGKTSTCHWIARALNEAGKQCALIGTLGNGFVDALQATSNTTPDAISLHRLMAEYLRAGAKAVAMEVSSHALAQGRVNGVRFDVALLTNLTRDHLDYHGDMESYAATKRRLFDWHSLKYAVINLDDAFGAELAQQLQGRDVEVIAYGLTLNALHLAERHGMRMVYGDLRDISGQGMQIEIRSSWGGTELNSPLIGRFNAENLLGALAVLLVSDVGFDEAVSSLCKVAPVSGRMQKVGGRGEPAVIVDYAHTPDALEKVLLALREVSVEKDMRGGGKLVCVFGCGGDRDRGKRAMMGRVAEKFADYCIVTSDNPRHEDPEQIIAEVAGGMNAGRHEIIVDRKAAIERAIKLAELNDIVLIAGKGHEDYQEISGVKHGFRDADVAMQALKNWPTKSGGVQ